MNPEGGFFAARSIGFVFASSAIPGMCFALVLSIFWIWMLADCLINESSQGNAKIIWTLVILLTYFLGALLYLVIRRPQRKRELGH
jgi:TRAP-type C4-dicarboxylate transport system permease large subunit